MRIFLSLLVLLCSAISPVWAVEEPQEPALVTNLTSEEEVLSRFFQTKAKEVEALQQEIGELEKKLQERETAFVPALENAQAQLRMLDVVARVVRARPYDMRVALARVKFLQKSLTKDYLPLETLTKEIELKGETIQALEEDLERKWADSLGRELRQDAQSIRKQTTEIGQQLKKIQTQSGKIKTMVDDVQIQLQEWITTFETKLPLIWKAEFLDPSGFLLLPPAGTKIGEVARDWRDNMKTFITSQYASVTHDSGDWLGMFVLFWMPFIFISFFAYRSLSGVFENDYAGGRLTVAFGFLSLSFALSLLAAFLSGKVKQTSFLLLCTHIFMLFGIQAIAWVCRNVRGVLHQPTQQPLLTLVFLSMSVAVLDILRLPQWTEHLLWIGLLVLSSLFFGLIQPQLRYERFIRRTHPYILAVLVTAAVLGWGKLAILASTLWGVLALAIQLGIGATSVIRVVVEKQAKTGLRAVIAELASTVLTLLLWAGVAMGVTTWVTINLGTSAVVDKLSSLELNWGDFSFNFLRVGVVLLLFQVVRSLALTWKAVMESDQLRWKNIDHGAAASLQRIGSYCLWLLYILVSLNLLGISLANFAVIAGGLSVGIGFGMQTIISNFISGLILLFDRSIQQGDIIEIDGTWVTVESVNIRNTMVRTFDNAKIFVPNSSLIAKELTNWTHRNDMRIRRDITVNVAYGSDVPMVKKLLIESAEEHPAVLNTPVPAALFTQFGTSSLDFTLRFWVRHVDFMTSAPAEIREAINLKFREAGIEMPFAQVDMHLRSSDGLLRVKTEHQEQPG